VVDLSSAGAIRGIFARLKDTVDMDSHESQKVARLQLRRDINKDEQLGMTSNGSPAT
jgi:hypothetical protein